MGYLKSNVSQIVLKYWIWWNLKNGGTNIQRVSLYVLLNILSISLLSRVNNTPGYFKVQNSHVILGFKEYQHLGGRLDFWRVY